MKNFHDAIAFAFATPFNVDHVCECVCTDFYSSFEVCVSERYNHYFIYSISLFLYVNKEEPQSQHLMNYDFSSM